MARNPRYWAFISYSHEDEAWARWVHRKLETYRVPRRLVGRTHHHVRAPRKLYPIFRDEDEMGAQTSLMKHIEEALRQSCALIVICSPAAVNSDYVEDETDYFIGQCEGRPILCLIVSGEPNAAGRPGCSAKDECFPKPLRASTAPVAADVRPGHDRKRDATLKLVAGILRIPYEEVHRREKRRQRRRLALVTLTVVSLLIGGPTIAFISTFNDAWDVFPDLGWVRLTLGPSNATMVASKGRSSYRGRHVPVHVYTAEAGVTSKVEVDPPQQGTGSSSHSVYYSSTLSLGQESWAALFLWAPGNYRNLPPLTFSTENCTHVFLTIRAMQEDRLRLGLKDIQGKEQKVTIDLRLGWCTYAIPLAAFERVDTNRLIMISLAHEENYAVNPTLELEIRDVFFESLREE